VYQFGVRNGYQVVVPPTGLEPVTPGIADARVKAADYFHGSAIRWLAAAELGRTF